MAIGNYGLIVDTSNFKPFTFDDLVKPFLLYKLDYEKMLDKIEKYDEEFGKLTLPEDSLYYDTLLNFKNQYADVSLRISEGDWARGSAEMRNLFRVARRDIAPIKEATIARNNYVSDFNKMLGLNPKLIYDQNEFKVDNFMGGNIPTLNVLNGDVIEKDSQELMIALAGLMEKMPEIVKVLKEGFVISKQKGITDSEALTEALNLVRNGVGLTGEESATVKGFVDFVDSIINKYDKPDYSSTIKQGILDYVISGIMKGIPGEQYGMQQDPMAENKHLELTRLLDLRKVDLTERAYELDALEKGVQYNRTTRQWEAIPEKISVPKLDENGNVVIDKTTGKPVMEEKDNPDYKTHVALKTIGSIGKASGKPDESGWVRTVDNSGNPVYQRIVNGEVEQITELEYNKKNYGVEDLGIALADANVRKLLSIPVSKSGNVGKFDYSDHKKYKHKKFGNNSNHDSLLIDRLITVLYLTGYSEMAKQLAQDKKDNTGIAQSALTNYQSENSGFGYIMDDNGFSPDLLRFIFDYDADSEDSQTLD